MSEEIKETHQLGISERSLDWRIVASAWLVAIIFVLLFGAADALASRHSSASSKSRLVGVVIPQHDPSVPGPEEIAAANWLERAKAEAYSGW
jgi:hypothetical protein